MGPPPAATRLSAASRHLLLAHENNAGSDPWQWTKSINLLFRYACAGARSGIWIMRTGDFHLVGNRALQRLAIEVGIATGATAAFPAQQLAFIVRQGWAPVRSILFRRFATGLLRLSYTTEFRVNPVGIVFLGIQAPADLRRLLYGCSGEV